MVTSLTPDTILREYGRILHSRRFGQRVETMATDRAVPLVHTWPSTSQVSEKGPSVLHTTCPFSVSPGALICRLSVIRCASVVATLGALIASCCEKTR
uniref:Uncharacterized protein n=1 Tax=Arundo donax TaxID=35708 RepID=A0A0A9DRL1_ARUDO